MEKQNLYSVKMTLKTEAELQEYIFNKSTYQPDAVLAAIWELQNRGYQFEELRQVEIYIENKKIKEQELLLSNDENNATVIDSQAPLLYKKNFIYVYGILFSILGGGILIALNFARIGKRNLMFPVIMTSILFTIVQIIILNYLEGNMSFISAPLSALGVFLLEMLYWNKHVKGDLVSKKRPIWGALIIGFIIVIPLILYTVSVLNNQ